MSNTLGRRNFLLTIGAMVSLSAVRAHAISQDDAVNLAQRAFGDLVNIGSSRSEDGVRRFFRTYSDVPSVARTVLGAPWRGLSSAEQQAYVSAFENYIVRKYTKLLKFIDGGSAEINGIRDTGRGGIVVTAQFSGPNGSGAVDLQISEFAGLPNVVDLKVEGISLVATERGAIRSMLGLSGNDFGAFVAKLDQG